MPLRRGRAVGRQSSGASGERDWRSIPLAEPGEGTSNHCCPLFDGAERGVNVSFYAADRSARSTKAACNLIVAASEPVGGASNARRRAGLLASARRASGPKVFAGLPSGARSRASYPLGSALQTLCFSCVRSTDTTLCAFCERRARGFARVLSETATLSRARAPIAALRRRRPARAARRKRRPLWRKGWGAPGAEG